MKTSYSDQLTFWKIEKQQVTDQTDPHTIAIWGLLS